MSRIGRMPIAIPSGVHVAQEKGVVNVKGPLGSLALTMSSHVRLDIADGQITVDRNSDVREARAHHGLMRNLVRNLVVGVSKGFERRLEIVGVGFKAESSSETLTLHLGYSHPVVYPIPEGITIKVDRNTKLKVSGIDLQLVGQVAANIRDFRRPDVYKGKGIRYEGEHIKLKAGKTGA